MSTIVKPLNFIVFVLYVRVHVSKKKLRKLFLAWVN